MAARVSAACAVSQAQKACTSGRALLRVATALIQSDQMRHAA